MTKINRITSVNDVIAAWPRLLKLALDDNPDVSPDVLLQLYLTCLRTGVVYFVRGDHGLEGACCIEVNHNGPILRALPKDNGQRHGKACIAEAVKWARYHGHKALRATTPRLCGSSFKYFEKGLGFRRKAVTFELQLNNYQD